MIGCGVVIFLCGKVSELHQWLVQNVGLNASLADIVNDQIVLNAYPGGESLYARLVLPSKGNGALEFDGATQAGQGTTNDNYFIVLQPSDQHVQLRINDTAGRNRMIIIAPDMEAGNVQARFSGEDCVLTVTTEGAPPFEITLVNGGRMQVNVELARGNAQNPHFDNAAQAYRGVYFDTITTMPVAELCQPARETGYEGGSATNVTWTMQAPSRLPVGDRLAQQQAPNADNSPLMAFLLPAVMMVGVIDRGLKTARHWVEEHLPGMARER